MIIENLSTLKINKLKQSQYDRELAAGNIDANEWYLTPYEDVDLSGYATKDDVNKKSDKEHGHVIADITGLQNELGQEITQAEFNALPESVRNTGTYYITDADDEFVSSGGSGNNGSVIKQCTVTATTTASGNIVLSTTPKEQVILCAYGNNSQIVSVGLDSVGNNLLRVLTTAGTVVISTQVTVVYYYIEL